VPHALLAQRDLEAVGEEVEKFLWLRVADHTGPLLGQ
jgi:hypothetical protein